MKIEDVKKEASIQMLTLDDELAQSVLDELKGIVESFDKLGKSNNEPLYFLEGSEIFDETEVNNMDIDDVIRNTKHVLNDQVKVPRVVE